MKLRDLDLSEADKRKFINLFRRNKTKCKAEYPEQYILYTADNKPVKERKTLIQNSDYWNFVGPKREPGAPKGVPHDYPENINKWRNSLKRNGLPRKADNTMNPEHKISHQNPKGAGRPHDEIDYKERYAQETVVYEMMEGISGAIQFSSIEGFYQGKYTPTEKLFALCAWLVTGTPKKASQFCGIPAGTISAFKQTNWWKSSLEIIQKDRQGDLDLALTKVIHKAAEVQLDRLEKGDIVPQIVKGEVQYVARPVTARDAAVVASQMADKRALMRGDPTTRVEKTSSQRLNELQKQFEKFAKAKTIEGEVESEG